MGYLEQLEQGLSQKLLLVSRICYFSWTALSGLSRRGSVYAGKDLLCQGWGDTNKGLHLSEDKRR